MEHSVALIRQAFLTRLKEDNFTGIGLHPAVPDSVHNFIDFLTAGNVVFRDFGIADRTRFPDLTDLQMTFDDFLGKPVTINGKEVQVAIVFRDTFCMAVAAALAHQIASEQARTPPDQLALSEVDAKSWREWADKFTDPDRLSQVGAALCDAARSTFAARPLLSFFIKAPVAGQFSMWGPWASTGEGRKLPVKVIECDGYSVTVRVSRYEEVECAVAAYEWEATLTMAGAGEPDAAACGMAYVFERSDGSPAGGLNDLIDASDSMADSDVIQVKSFITQHDDAQDVIERSDLAFVWIWERRGGTAKGLGEKCLVPALQDLRRRFKKLRTIVFDARPAQFLNWTSRVDPPMVALEKQTAIENLIGHIQALKLDFDVRCVFARSDDPESEALAALGQSFEPRARDADGDDDDDDHDHAAHDQIDYMAWEEEISALLRAAGLGELAEAFEDYEAPDDDVMAAIKYIVFDSRVHYLRPSSSGAFQPADVHMFEKISHDEAHERLDGMDEFCNELPEGMRVSHAYLLDDGAVCAVQAITPFGQLTEYFTLVRKPRPINVEAFFRGIE